MLTLTIAGPVRTYFAQRTEMKQLAASEASLRQQIADLESQKAKLADPVYIAAQARERLGFVMPGDIPYQVQLPPGAGAAAETRPASRGRPEQRPLVHLAVAHHRRYAARAAEHAGAAAHPSVAAAAGARPGATWWLIPPISTRWRGSWGASRAACWRSPTAARMVNPPW